MPEQQEKRCGTCWLFDTKDGYYGKCTWHEHWSLPSSLQRQQMHKSYGKECPVWEEMSKEAKEARDA